MSEPVRRRRRVRSVEVNGPADLDEGTPADASVAVTAPVADEPAPGWVVETADPDTLPAERGLRGLVGGGSSQVSPAAAMRARDAARPRPQDLARAEADLTIIRRHWSPRE